MNAGSPRTMDETVEEIGKYHDAASRDADLVRFQGVSMSDPVEVVKVMKTSLRVTSNYSRFVKVVQLLAALPVKGTLGERSWKTVEGMLKSYGGL